MSKQQEIEWLPEETWEEHLAKYPHPKPIPVPPDHNVPDAIVQHNYCLDWETDRKMHGFIVQLLTAKAYEVFPEALTEGPTRGLLWFDDRDLGNLCALEGRLKLEFSGIV